MSTEAPISAPERIVAPPPPVQASRSVSFDLSRTWELELLISGAVIFSLLQLPPQLTLLHDRLVAQITGPLGGAEFFAYFYAKAIVYGLTAFFLAHLMTRAYWVGLVGLDSVFPDGVRWESLKQGPIGRRVYRERLPSVRSQMAVLDNVSSVLFSFGFGIVLMVGISLVLMAVFGAIAYLLSATFFGEEHFREVFFAMVALTMGPSMLASLVDRTIGERLDPDSRAGRLVRVLTAWNLRLNFITLYGPALFTLFTNVRGRVIYPVFYAVFFGLMGGMALDVFAHEGIISVRTFSLVPPDHDPNVVRASFYEDQRREGEVLREVPSIQSDVIDDAYVRLFVPFTPARMARAVAAGCPGREGRAERNVTIHFGRAEPAARERSSEVLRCIGAFAGLHVNGSPRPDVEFSFYTHPRTGVRGVLAYLPTAELPRGRNEISLREVPPREGAGRPGSRSEPWAIPFWR